MDTTKKVLITGGTGTMGSAVVKRLTEKGYQVRVLKLCRMIRWLPVLKELVPRLCMGI